MSVPFNDLSRLDEDTQRRVEEACLRVLRSGKFILGREVEAFERSFSARLGDDVHAVAVSSGTDALLMSLMALGIGPGDEVIVPDFTFFSPAGCVARLGATPVFVDIDSDFGLDPQRLEEAFSPRTRAVIPVHLFGGVCDMARIVPACQARNVPIIEDAAQAVLASRDDQPAGLFGALGCFSFFPTKNLGAAGDAGLIVTKDPERAEQLRMMRTHGARPKYVHQMIGGNFRMDAIQAAVLNAKLNSLSAWTSMRQTRASTYSAELKGLPHLTLPSAPAGVHHTFHQYTIRVDPHVRDQVSEFLAMKGIETQIYYPAPLHSQPCFNVTGHFPQAEKACKSVLSLPNSAFLQDDEQARIIEALHEFF